MPPPEHPAGISTSTSMATEPSPTTSTTWNPKSSTPRSPNCLGWLRNPDRKSWSFTIPYERRPGEYKPVFPDFLFFRQEGDRVVIDILDPHGAHLPDAVTKAKGLALYAQTHGHRFGRIETIDRIDGQLRRLNLKDHSIRDQLNTVTNNDGLGALYKARANNARY